MSKIRINDLARELEVKSKSILDVLPEVGVTEKKSHSSSLEDHEADKVRARLRAASAAQSSSRSSRTARPDGDEIKTKIDLSHISKPGDALKAIISKQQGPGPRRQCPRLHRPSRPGPQSRKPRRPRAFRFRRRPRLRLLLRRNLWFPLRPRGQPLRPRRPRRRLNPRRR